MATNKHAIVRYRTIDRCLKDRDRSWTWQDLRDACEAAIEETTGRHAVISERTLKYDIAAMRSNDILGYYAPIRYDRKEKTYYYSDLKYSLTETPITKKDKRDLNSALQLLQQFIGQSHLMGLQTILTKLHNSIDRYDSENTKFIQFDHPLESKDQRWLYGLYQAILQKQCVNIVYHPFGKSRSTRRVSPYLLKEYKRRWYLISFDHLKKAIRVYALDRIEDLSPSLDQYHLDDEFHVEDYFRDIVGVSLLRDKEVVKIHIQVFGRQVDYFLTQPLHASQRIIERKDNSTIFEIRVRINIELIRELLSYGASVRVISPDLLVSQIREELVKQLNHY